MALASEGMNPNNDVSGEGHVSTGANSVASFEDLDEADYDVETGSTKKKRAAPGKAESGAKDKVKEDDPKDAEKAKGAEKKAAPKEKADSKGEKEDGKEAEADKQSQDGKEKKAKAKVHKFTHGEASGDVSGDAVFSIPINGVKENVSLQDLVNEYNGKKFYEGQHGTLTSEKRKFEKERNDLNQVVADFSERAKKDPDGAWDFLAELNGANPIEFKENMLRSQIKAMEPLMAMTPEEREAWIGQKKLEWREKIVSSKEQRTGQQAASVANQQAKQQAQEKFGISDEDYQKHYDGVKQYLKGQEPHPNQVAWASRAMVVQNAIQKATPELANHPQRDKIVADLAADMMENPKMTQATIEATLKQVFGADDEALKRASRNAKKNANYDADDSGRKNPKAVRGYESFDDL